MTAHELRRSANGATKEPLADFTGQGTILLVEDEQSLRSLIARGLRSRGYSVIEASNGVEALEALEQSNVDLVVSDVVMPESVRCSPLCPGNLSECANGRLDQNRPLLELSPLRPKAIEPVRERGTAPVSSSTRTVARAF